MDNMTKRQRSETMSKIRSEDTSPERKLRRSLFRLRYRYRKNVSYLPGCPDIVMRKYHSVIFINGCFWHHHQGCSKATIPHTNRPYWQEKLKRNTSRDATNLRMLKNTGWRVLTIWECEINKDFDATLIKVVEFLKATSD